MTGKTRVKIGFIQPGFIGYGGLESYAAHFIEALLEDWRVDVISCIPVEPQDVQRAFGIKLESVQFIHDVRCFPNDRKYSGPSFLTRHHRARIQSDFAALTSKYDLVIGPAFGLPWKVASRLSCLLCHFPVVYDLKVDRSVNTGFLQRLSSSVARSQHEIQSRLNSWTEIVVNSHYSEHYVQQFWSRSSDVIYPPIALASGPSARMQKQKKIVSAGFFSAPAAGEKYSYKRQELLIEAFRQLCESGVVDWELHLAGHLLVEQTPFMDELKRRVGELPVFFHPNCARGELLQLYDSAAVYWHATGFGIDEKACPEKAEHFGIVIAEAMSWGCIPMVVPKGGTPEVVGPLAEWSWNSVEQLVEKTIRLAQDAALRTKLCEQAIQQVQQFGIPRFRRNVQELCERLLSGASSAGR